MFLQNSLMVQTKARVLLSVLLPTWEQAVFMQFWQEKKSSYEQEAVFSLCAVISAAVSQHGGAQRYVTWNSTSVCLHASASLIHALKENHTPLACMSMYEHVWASAVWDAVVQGLVLNAAYFKAHSEASASTSSSSRLLFVRLSHERSHQTSPTNRLVDENTAFPLLLVETKSVREAKLDKIVLEQLDHSSLELMPSAPVTFSFCFFFFFPGQLKTDWDAIWSEFSKSSMFVSLSYSPVVELLPSILPSFNRLRLKPQTASWWPCCGWAWSPRLTWSTRHSAFTTPSSASLKKPSACLRGTTPQVTVVTYEISKTTKHMQEMCLRTWMVSNANESE